MFTCVSVPRETGDLVSPASLLESEFRGRDLVCTGGGPEEEQVDDKGENPKVRSCLGYSCYL